jgi:coenzyme F420-reducing hydrogenase delta subunit/DNA-binding transcriptional ArsR family regulator
VYGAADLAGVSRLQYTTDIRLIRVMCSGRVDLEFILRAFLNGQDGVFIGGCRLDECNYVTHGNYDALSNTYLAKKLLENIGINPDRLRIEFMSGADGNILADVTSDFASQVKTMGPLGESEGMNKDTRIRNLKAVMRLVPYIKLVERERLRVPQKTKKAYDAFFTSDEFSRLFDELIVDKLSISRMMLLLKEKPRSTGEIVEALGLDPSDVSKHMNRSSQHGLVRYDEELKCYALG